MIPVQKTLKICLLLGCVLLMGGFLQNEQFEKGQYPEPRFPSYLQEPQSAEEVMRAVRGLVACSSRAGPQQIRV